MRIIKVISFDLEGTLVTHAFSDLVWEVGVPALYAREKGISREEAEEYVLAEYQKVGSGRKEWYDIKYWFRSFQLKSSWEDVLERNREAVAVYPEVVDVLKSLQDKYNLALTTNTSREFLLYLLKPVEKYFNNVFSATSDFGTVKSKPDFYRTVCRNLKVEPENMAHVGDDYLSDFQVPLMVGIMAFHLDRSHKESGENVFSDLLEFRDTLRRMATT